MIPEEYLRKYIVRWEKEYPITVPYREKEENQTLTEITEKPGKRREEKI